MKILEESTELTILTKIKNYLEKRLEENEKQKVVENDYESGMIAGAREECDNILWFIKGMIDVTK
jgi:hypothetical protein